MFDYSKPFGAGNTEQELVAGLETFDPFADYTQTTVAAFYTGSCGPIRDPVINFYECSSAE